MNDDSPEWVSVAEAARYFHIAERQARRYVARLADNDRNIDRTSHGKPRLLVRLKAFCNVLNHRKSNAVSPDFDRTYFEKQEQAAISLIAAHERVIAEQKSRIVDLQAALEHERAQTRILLESAAKTQMSFAQRLDALPQMPWWRRVFIRRHKQ